MRSFTNTIGFTLIELIVAITLIGIMLVFTIPRFQDTLLTDSTRKASRWLVGTISALKENSLIDGKVHSLHVSMNTNTLWVTDDAMDETDMLEAEASGYQLPENVRLLDVEFPERGKVSISRADILFYPQGYSDKALIHMQSKSRGEMTFLIEPFLSDVMIFEKYAGFDDE